MSKLSDLIKEKNKKAKSEQLSFGVKKFDYSNFLPLSSPLLNWMLYGGLPLNRIIEFCGEENSGKTTTALDAIGCMQRYLKEKDIKDKYCCFIDVENTYDAGWANLLGVNNDELVLVKTEEQTAEQIFDTVDELIETGEIALLVIDSIGVLVPQSVYEESYEKKNYGGNAASLARFSSKMVSKLTRYNSTCIMINQVREDLDNPYNQYKAPGGKGLKHNQSLRLMFKKGQMFDEEGKEVKQSFENPQSHEINCHLLKTKVFAPNRRLGRYTLNYRKGIDVTKDLIEAACYYNLISKGGSWFELLDENGEQVVKLQGILKVNDYLKENIEYRNKLLNAVNKCILTEK